jgi:hypothetical protein
MIDYSQDDDANQLKAENLAIEHAMHEAVNEAILAHKRLGLPMVEWQNGQIVWVPADKLDLDDDAPTPG